MQVKTTNSTQSTSGIVGIFVNIRWLHEQTPQKYFKCNHYISSSQRKTNITKMNAVIKPCECHSYFQTITIIRTAVTNSHHWLHQLGVDKYIIINSILGKWS
jgi:hypothetical protein